MLNVETTNYLYRFEGPYNTVDPLLEDSGVFCVTTVDKKGNHKILDVGEAKNVKDRIKFHNRKDSWKQNSEGSLYVSALYCSEAERAAIEEDIKESYTPLCATQ